MSIQQDVVETFNAFVKDLREMQEQEGFTQLEVNILIQTAYMSLIRVYKEPEQRRDCISVYPDVELEHGYL